MKRTNGWDERDYQLWSKIQALPSYGLIAGCSDNPMISRQAVESAIRRMAEKRFDLAHSRTES